MKALDIDTVPPSFSSGTGRGCWHVTKRAAVPSSGSSGRTSPERTWFQTQRAALGLPGKSRLLPSSEKPDQQDDDEDESDGSCADVHESSPFACGTNAYPARQAGTQALDQPPDESMAAVSSPATTQTTVETLRG